MLRFRMRKMSIKGFLLFVILACGIFIKIGYAYLSQDLTISGTAIASKNIWDVHFVDDTIAEDTTHLSTCVNPGQCSRVTAPATISDDGISVNFGVVFHVIGDYYEFTVDVVNEGTIDAMLNDIVKENFASYSDYLDFTVTYSDGIPLTQYDQLLKCGDTETLRVKVQFINAPSNDVNASLGITINYLQADNHKQLRGRDPATRIRALNTLGESIADDDPDGNLRFIGSNPNNYVSFNGQIWRIIGVFDGKLKIVESPIGNYTWDTSRNTVNNGYGVNQWGPSTLSDNSDYDGADLMKLLNPGYENNRDLKCNVGVTNSNSMFYCGDNSDSNYSTVLVNNSLWWNASSGNCYNSGNYSATTCNFTSTGLKTNEARNMIDNATWHLGSNNASENLWDGRLNASYLYNFERGTLNGKQCSNATHCSDHVNRTVEWQGKVGLIYPSDYVYATGGGQTHDRDTCLRVHSGYVSSDAVSNWVNTYTDCKNNDWLLNTGMWTWTLSPRADSSDSTCVFSVHQTGFVYSHYASYAGSVRPVVFLKSSVTFTDEGDGTQSHPFALKVTGLS